MSPRAATPSGRSCCSSSTHPWDPSRAPDGQDHGLGVLPRPERLRRGHDRPHRGARWSASRPGSATGSWRVAPRIRRPQMEAHDANYVGGDINGGIQDIRQLLFRPTPSLDPYHAGRRALPRVVIDATRRRRPRDGRLPRRAVGAAAGPALGATASAASSRRSHRPRNSAPIGRDARSRRTSTSTSNDRDDLDVGEAVLDRRRPAARPRPVEPHAERLERVGIRQQGVARCRRGRLRPARAGCRGRRGSSAIVAEHGRPRHSSGLAPRIENGPSCDERSRAATWTLPIVSGRGLAVRRGPLQCAGERSGRGARVGQDGRGLVQGRDDRTRSASSVRSARLPIRVARRRASRPG